MSSDKDEQRTIEEGLEKPSRSGYKGTLMERAFLLPPTAERIIQVVSKLLEY